MKKLIFTFLSISAVFALSAQEIINGGFENWTNEVIFQNPSEWESSNLEFFFADEVTVTQDNDATDGEQSAYLETVEINDEMLFGFVMLGSFGDDEPESGFAYNGIVDGMTCSLKYHTQPDDSATVLIVAFFNDEIVEMQIAKPSGIQNEWTDFTLNFDDPVLVDEVMIAFASSNAMEEFAVDGSWLMVDNVSLISNGVNVGSVPNGSFETWEDHEMNSPDDWNTNDMFSIDLVEEVSDAYLGNSAIKLVNGFNEEDNEPIQAYVTNGIITDEEPEGGQVIDDRPEMIYGHFKYTPSGVDTGLVYVQFWFNENMIGTAWVPLFEANEWTGFEQEINYTTDDTPDMVTISATPGENEGSVLFLDELSFTFVTGIEEKTKSDIHVYPNPFLDELYINLNDGQELNAIEIYDLSGKMVHQSAKLNGQNRIDLNGLEKGLYQMRVYTSEGVVHHVIIK